MKRSFLVLRGSFSRKGHCCPTLFPPLDSALRHRVATVGKLWLCQNAENVEVIGFENSSGVSLCNNYPEISCMSIRADVNAVWKPLLSDTVAQPDICNRGHAIRRPPNFSRPPDFNFLLGSRPLYFANMKNMLCKILQKKIKMPAEGPLTSQGLPQFQFPPRI